MSIKEKLQDFKYRLRIFIWYLLTEPWRQIKEIIGLLNKIVHSLNKTLTWTYIAAIFIIISLFRGNKYGGGLFVLFLLFTVLLWEWERGYFIHRHRLAVKKKIKKESKENGRNIRSNDNS